MYQLVIWCRYGVDIAYIVTYIWPYLVQITKFCLKFELRLKVSWSIYGCHGTNSKHPKHDYVCCVTTYLCAKYDIDGLSNFWITDVSVFSQSEALICSVGASPDSDLDSMGESESESRLESGRRLYPCGLGLGLHFGGLGLMDSDSDSTQVDSDSQWVQVSPVRNVGLQGNLNFHVQ